MKEDHHDTRILHHLKEKLHEVLKTESEFEDFKQRYNKLIENNILDKIVEKKKKTAYYSIIENKDEKNLILNDISAPLNKYKPRYSAMPHDHIHPQHYLSDPERANREKWKYLAYFDIILDQHLRQIRPDGIVDEKFKYIKEENKPIGAIEDHVLDNMYFDYNYKLDNEFYLKFKDTINQVIDFKAKEEETNSKDNKVNTKYNLRIIQ